MAISKITIHAIIACMAVASVRAQYNGYVGVINPYPPTVSNVPTYNSVLYARKKPLSGFGALSAFDLFGGIGQGFGGFGGGGGGLGGGGLGGFGGSKKPGLGGFGGLGGFDII